MLTVYKRHSSECPHRVRSYRRCDCPCWVEGTVEGKYYRESLKTRNWTRATEIVRHREQDGGIAKGKITIKHATAAFITDAKARGLQPSSIYKYDLMLKQLREFCINKGLEYITECDIENLRGFRESWKNKNFSARKKLEALRTFFRFVHDTGWLPTNPAKLIRPPKTNDPPTLPFSQEEFKCVMAACDKYSDKKSAVRLRALTLLLRYSGLRISDAVTLTRDKIKDDILVLRTAKTGTPVRIPLPESVLKALSNIKTDNEFYFWSGQGTPKSCASIYQRSFKRLYEIAEVKNGHAHRWRDTFAVELLLSGMPLDQVSVLLGHQSIKVTEKHYSPWVKVRQDQLEAAVRKTF